MDGMETISVPFQCIFVYGDLHRICPFYRFDFFYTFYFPIFLALFSFI